MDNMWNYMAGPPYSAVNNGGMNGLTPGDIPGYDQWPGYGPGAGYGSGMGYGPGAGYGPCPWDGYGPWMPPDPKMDCWAVLRCIHRCMQGYMHYMPGEGPMEDYGAGYGPGPGMPSVPPMDDTKG